MGKPPAPPREKSKSKAASMAISHLSVKVGSSGKAGPHAAYIAREGKYADRLEIGEKLEATEAGNMPAWAQASPQEFWQAADQNERANGTTYREFEIALPRELAAADRLALVREFIQQELGDRHAYQFAIHCPTAVDGKDQPHAHIMFSERQRDGIERDPAQYFKRYNAKVPEKGGAKKGWGEHAGDTRSKAERAEDLKALRQRWETTCNAALERAGHAERIDLRSNAERGINRPPERKMRPSEWRTRRAEVIEFRQARAELSKAVPNVAAEIINLEERRREAERPKGADRPGPAVQSSRFIVKPKVQEQKDTPAAPLSPVARQEPKEAKPNSRNVQMAKSFANEPPVEAVTKYPELAGAYATVAAIEKKAEADGLDERQMAVVSARVREVVANSIERGEIPNTKIREEKEVTQTRSNDRGMSR